MTPTPLFRPKFRVEECLEAIRECLETGWSGSGFKTLAFEQAWRDHTGFPHAHFINSNTAGLHLALCLFKRRYGWQDGDEVITTPLTFVSTNHAILYEHLTPVFADIDPHLCLDPADVERRISARTRAVMFVGVGGNAGQYEYMVALCRERGLMLILDGAHMAGTTLNGRQIGTDADAAVFSFQSVKNLPTADAGMICLRSPDDDARVRALSWLGIDKDTYARVAGDGTYAWEYEVDEVGFKYHGNSIMASIGLTQLRYLDEDNACRRRIAAGYEARLRDHPAVGLVPVPGHCASARCLFQIRVANREQVIGRLRAHRVSVGVHYRDNTEYPMYRHGRGTCPAANAASRELLSLPMHLDLTDRDLDEIAGAVVQSTE